MAQQDALVDPAVMQALQAQGAAIEAVHEDLRVLHGKVDQLDTKVNSIDDRLTELASGQREILKRLDKLTFPAKPSGRVDLSKKLY